MRVSDKSRIAKQSIQAAGLRGITGLYLYEIVRADGTHLPAVSHDTLLEVRFRGFCGCSQAWALSCKMSCSNGAVVVIISGGQKDVLLAQVPVFALQFSQGF